MTPAAVYQVPIPERWFGEGVARMLADAQEMEKFAFHDAHYVHRWIDAVGTIQVHAEDDPSPRLVLAEFDMSFEEVQRIEKPFSRIPIITDVAARVMGDAGKPPPDTAPFEYIEWARDLNATMLWVPLAYPRLCGICYRGVEIGVRLRLRWFGFRRLH